MYALKNQLPLSSGKLIKNLASGSDSHKCAGIKSLKSIPMTSLLLVALTCGSANASLNRDPPEDIRTGAIKSLQVEIKELVRIKIGQKITKKGNSAKKAASKAKLIATATAAAAGLVLVIQPESAPITAPIAGISKATPYVMQGMGKVLSKIGEEIEHRGERSLPALSISESIEYHLWGLIQEQNDLILKRDKKLNHPALPRKLLEKISSKSRLKRYEKIRRTYSNSINNLQDEIEKWSAENGKVGSMSLVDKELSLDTPEKANRIQHYATELEGIVEFLDWQLVELERLQILSPKKLVDSDLLSRKYNHKKRLIAELMELTDQ